MGHRGAPRGGRGIEHGKQCGGRGTHVGADHHGRRGRQRNQPAGSGCEDHCKRRTGRLNDDSEHDAQQHEQQQIQNALAGPAVQVNHVADAVEGILENVNAQKEQAETRQRTAQGAILPFPQDN